MVPSAVGLHPPNMEPSQMLSRLRVIIFCLPSHNLNQVLTVKRDLDLVVVSTQFHYQCHGWRRCHEIQTMLL